MNPKPTSPFKIVSIGLLIGFLLNVFGWLGNNFLLNALWQQVGEALTPFAWRSSIWRDVFSLIPDFVYGIAIVWLVSKLKRVYASYLMASFAAGCFVSIIGGITTYFAIANSGFIPWKLALASFGLVFLTKLPLAVLAGYLLEGRAGNAKA